MHARRENKLAFEWRNVKYLIILYKGILENFQIRRERIWGFGEKMILKRGWGKKKKSHNPGI